MRNHKTFNLTEAIASIPPEQGCELTFAELANAHAVAVCDGSDLRLRKWVAGFGSLSAWKPCGNQKQAQNIKMLGLKQLS